MLKYNDKKEKMGGKVQQIDEKLMAEEKMCNYRLVQLGEKAEEMGECGDDAVWGTLQLAGMLQLRGECKEMRIQQVEIDMIIKVGMMQQMEWGSLTRMMMFL